MASWNDSSFDGVDWAEVSFLGMFCDAIGERLAAGGLGGSPPAVSTGDDVQARSFILGLQGFVLDPDTLNAFVDLGVSITASTPGDILAYGTTTNLFTEAGISTAFGFKRCRPREITSTAATTDTEGNAAATGQRAYLYPGGLYICVTSGSWTRELTAGARPDTLSNYSAVPNAIANLDDGIIQVGDYIGPWIFEQLRDALNCLLWISQMASIGGSSFSRKTGITGQSLISYADAITNAQAAYAAATPDTSTPTLQASSFSNYGVVAPSTWNVQFDRGQARLVASSISTSSSHTVDFYLYAIQATPEWDDNGDAVTEDVFVLVESVGPTASATVETAEFGDITNPPNTFSVDPATLGVFDPSGRGWVTYTAAGPIIGALAVIRFDVVGGFVYKP